MDMPRIISFLTISCLLALPVSALASEQSQSVPETMTPIDRGYGQHDACFGDKYESEDDLKTGNELAVQEILKQLLGPGT